MNEYIKNSRETIAQYEKELAELKPKVADGEVEKKEYETLYNKKTAL